MTATFYVGDSIAVMNRLPEKSVDLILTSPPFLALRSYLPQDHPDKALEGGSQSTPGEYIDWLIDVVEACARVLAPHGSLCFELGDTYSGSGGAGGDYAADGLRDGQPPHRQNWREGSEGNRPGFGSWTGANRDGAGGRRRRVKVSPDNPSERSPRPNRKMGDGEVLVVGGDGWPLAKSLSLIPETFRFAMVYGHNPHTGRTTPPWRLRNVIRWVRPNPPVGALGDKFRPATSELMVFCKAKDRFFDLDAVREPHSKPIEEMTGTTRRGNPDGRHGGGDDKLAGILRPMPGNPAGAPPLDWWNIPPGGYPGAHYAVWPPELLVKPIKAMCPSLVCVKCGPVYDVRTMPQSGSAEERPLLLQEVRVGLGSETTGTEQGLHDPSGLHHGEWNAGPSDGDSGGLHIPASSSHGEVLGPDALAERGRSSQERNQERQSGRELGSDGPGRPHNSGTDGTRTPNNAMSPLRGSSEFIRDCPTCGGNLRAGTVLDPFAGSGTTLSVATGHGRDAIGIDLDERNYELALDRVGPLILERGTEPARRINS